MGSETLASSLVVEFDSDVHGGLFSSTSVVSVVTVDTSSPVLIVSALEGGVKEPLLRVSHVTPPFASLVEFALRSSTEADGRFMELFLTLGTVNGVRVGEFDSSHLLLVGVTNLCELGHVVSVGPDGRVLIDGVTSIELSGSHLFALDIVGKLNSGLDITVLDHPLVGGDGILKFVLFVEVGGNFRLINKVIECVNYYLVSLYCAADTNKYFTYEQESLGVITEFTIEMDMGSEGVGFGLVVEFVHSTDVNLVTIFVVSLTGSFRL